MRRAMMLVPVLLAGCTQTAAERVRGAEAQDAARAGLERELAGLRADAPLQCLPSRARSDLRAYGSTLVYRVSGGLKYRNDTTGGCEGVARRDDILVTRSPQGRVCGGDIADTVDRTSRIPTGGCALGSFIPYRKP